MGLNPASGTTTMNYVTIYDNLINRAKIRKTDLGYYEKHHVIPRCLGGNDNKDNIVKLTAREHLVAHLCLVKMYPGNHALVKAAVMMSCGSHQHNRSKNRRYEWLRKKHSYAMSDSQSGKGNSQYGTVWVFNKVQSKKIKVTELTEYLDAGWNKGRIIRNFENTHQVCEICKVEFRHAFKKKTCSDVCHKEYVGKHKSFVGKEEELRMYYEQTRSINKSLKLMGFPGAISHYYYWAKTVIT